LQALFEDLLSEKDIHISDKEYPLFAGTLGGTLRKCL